MENDVLISSTRLYDGKIFKLDLDRIRFPDGSAGEMAVVRHPGASAVVPFLSDPRGEDPDLLLLRQYRYAAGGYLYEIPAGRLDPGETPIQCARRELREETGCTVAGLEELCAPFMTPGFADEKIHIFLATGLTRGEPSHEADEFAEVQVVKLSRALAMIKQGEMVDAKSIIGILFAAGRSRGRQSWTIDTPEHSPSSRKCPYCQLCQSVCCAAGERPEPTGNQERPNRTSACGPPRGGGDPPVIIIY